MRKTLVVVVIGLKTWRGQRFRRPLSPHCAVPEWEVTSCTEPQPGFSRLTGDRTRSSRCTSIYFYASGETISMSTTSMSTTMSASDLPTPQSAVPVHEKLRIVLVVIALLKAADAL